jgi:prepilin-type N-terminal cleavage/methylation domain-containing protein
MSFVRLGRRGFSLTEILMAVGILGVGMTMVASIFPVAVDQTRRANDTTMAALCARSIAATIRANRAAFVTRHHDYFKTMMTGSDTDKERPAEFGLQTVTASSGNPGLVYSSADTVISKNMRVYNPNLFVYDAGKRYETEIPVANPYWPMWNAGNYVPIIYVTPIVPPDKRIDNATTGLYNTDGGPWRVTIVVFKSRGLEKLHPRVKSWNSLARNTTTGEPTFSAGSGDYVLDRGLHAGECYMIDFANIDTAKTIPASGGALGNALNPPILLACGVSAGALKYAPTAISVNTNVAWHPLPGAVAAFHTVIGD